ncbi:BRO-N domain-containing protein [Azotobacter beijerinckii]|uniref:BRO family, N-terminal domain n=1 Tax=Azotobacter beijerinckii TaxID=170623 RepID=A0A1I4H801_9GAMM|nr:Bro-N domain-containing protein [Azotobacter beijerinckii]SFB60184.1 BRO family, N-terminal domain [Azotobacter beijerinckii]SFL38285.1 BRO family, N-terminal domain [Azotobacter beijerinckii]
MTQEVQLFNFEKAQVRLVTIDGEPWFVAKDVAAVLGYAKPRNAIASHCKGALIQGVLTTGGIQDMTLIPERDLYRLVMKSHLPSAERFEEWVVGEVLPTIRKTGGYSVPAAPRELSRLELIQMALQSEQERLLLAATIEEQAIKIDALQSLFKEGMSPAEFCKGLNGVNVMQVGNHLESRGWLFNESKTGVRWRVASYARDRYMTEHQQQITPHGQEPFIRHTPILLRKGAERLFELYLKRGLPMKKTLDGQFTHDKAERSAA